LEGANPEGMNRGSARSREGVGETAAASRLEQDLRAQPESLNSVLRQQYGDGLPSLLRAASLLRSGRRVVITGMGASLFASIPLAYDLLSRGIDTVTLEAGEMLHYGQEAYRDAVVVVVSRSGESVEIAKLLAILKGRQPVIGLSNVPASLLSREADVSLHIGSLSDEMVAIQTYTGTLLAHYLLGRAVDDSLENARAELAALLPAFARVVAASFDERRLWEDFLEEGVPVHLLARGASLASAHEGALLFNEVAKSPAIGMPLASFRHGPVEVVDQAFRGIIFAPDGRTRNLNLSLARDIVRFGGQVRVIGPDESDPATDAAGDLASCIVPACSELLVPLFEVVPLQVAALTLAVMRGIRPGSFRFTPQVATDESSFRPG
jgi:glutamine---fructose-6-phosphate transaminase (isomerizing)